MHTSSKASHTMMFRPKYTNVHSVSRYKGLVKTHFTDIRAQFGALFGKNCARTRYFKDPGSHWRVLRMRRLRSDLWPYAPMSVKLQQDHYFMKVSLWGHSVSDCDLEIYLNIFCLQAIWKSTRWCCGRKAVESDCRARPANSAWAGVLPVAQHSEL